MPHDPGSDVLRHVAHAAAQPPPSPSLGLHPPGSRASARWAPAVPATSTAWPADPPYREIERARQCSGRSEHWRDVESRVTGRETAVLIDATVVRGILLPAVISLLGERCWYLPRWLSWLAGRQLSAGSPVAAASREHARPAGADESARRADPESQPPYQRP